MERGRHVQAFRVVVGAFKGDVFGSEISTDTLEKSAEIHAGPLANIVPPFHANMPDNELLLRERIELIGAPGSLVRNAARQLEAPGRCIDRSHVLDRIIRVEARRLDHLRL